MSKPGPEQPTRQFQLPGVVRDAISAAPAAAQPLMISYHTLIFQAIKLEGQGRPEEAMALHQQAWQLFNAAWPLRRPQG